jgi:hypothetical protein
MGDHGVDCVEKSNPDDQGKAFHGGIALSTPFFKMSERLRVM